MPWSRIAAVLVINRLCSPDSELAIEERLYPATALDDLLYLPDGTINDSGLYRAFDHLLPHKTAPERPLATRYGGLFAAEFGVLLDDPWTEVRDEVEAQLARLQSGDSERTADTTQGTGGPHT